MIYEGIMGTGSQDKVLRDKGTIKAKVLPDKWGRREVACRVDKEIGRG